MPSSSCKIQLNLRQAEQVLLAGYTHFGRPKSACSQENSEADKTLLEIYAEKEADDPDINTFRNNQLGVASACYLLHDSK